MMFGITLRYKFIQNTSLFLVICILSVPHNTQIDGVEKLIFEAKKKIQLLVV